MPDEKYSRWDSAQTKEDEFWKRDRVLDNEVKRCVERYAPVFRELSKDLPATSAILDMGCGPTCPAQYFTVGTKTFMDPLMDSYVNTYGSLLPKGELLTGTAEAIPRPDESFDVITCFNALDHMLDPDKALSEMRRVLKPDGMLIVGLFVHPGPIASLRMVVEKWFPFLREDAHPYSYTLESIQALLAAHVRIDRKIRVFRKDTALFPSLHREDWMFICKKK